MADYPDGVYSPRTKGNKPGVVYDATKKTIGYAEDVTKLDNEVVAIETELGTNPKGAFASVKAFLEDLLSRTKQIICSGICDYGIDKGITKYFWVGRSMSDGFQYICGIMPVAGKLKKLYVRMAWNDCNGESTLTLYKNNEATALTITIPAGNGYTTISDTTHEVIVAAGDRVAFKVIVGGTAGAIGLAGISLIFVPS